MRNGIRLHSQIHLRGLLAYESNVSQQFDLIVACILNLLEILRTMLRAEGHGVELLPSLQLHFLEHAQALANGLFVLELGHSLLIGITDRFKVSFHGHVTDAQNLGDGTIAQPAHAQPHHLLAPVVHLTLRSLRWLLGSRLADTLCGGSRRHRERARTTRLCNRGACHALLFRYVSNVPYHYKYALRNLSRSESVKSLARFSETSCITDSSLSS